jgi:hypothetical protein
MRWFTEMVPQTRLPPHPRHSKPKPRPFQAFPGSTPQTQESSGESSSQIFELRAKSQLSTSPLVFFYVGMTLLPRLKAPYSLDSLPETEGSMLACWQHTHLYREDEQRPSAVSCQFVVVSLHFKTSVVDSVGSVCSARASSAPALPQRLKPGSIGAAWRHPSTRFARSGQAPSRSRALLGFFPCRFVLMSVNFPVASCHTSRSLA